MLQLEADCTYHILSGVEVDVWDGHRNDHETGLDRIRGQQLSKPDIPSGADRVDYWLQKVH
jgi:hypothetical protein